MHDISKLILTSIKNVEGADACCDDFFRKRKKNGKLGYEDSNKNAKFDSDQPKITRMFESTRIEQNKVEMANRVIMEL